MHYTVYSIHPNKLDVLEFWTKLVSVETGCSGCTEIIENRKLYRKFPQCAGGVTSELKPVLTVISVMSVLFCLFIFML